MPRTPEETVPRIVSDLVDQMLDGTLEPGTKLSTSKIANGINASRLPVREALRELSVLGVVEYLPNRGFRVPPRPTPDKLIALLDVRVLLEPEAHALAAKRASNEEKDAIIEVFGRGSQAESSGAYGTAARLHHQGIRLIVEASHHAELQRALTPLLIRSALHFPSMRAAANHRGWTQHQSSAQAVADSDQMAARLRASQHLQFLRGLIEELGEQELRRPRIRARKRP